MDTPNWMKRKSKADVALACLGRTKRRLKEAIGDIETVEKQIKRMSK